MVIALVLLQVGVLASTGLIRLALAELAEAARRDRAQWAVGALADSLVAGRAATAGARVAEWGGLTWEPLGDGVLIVARRPGGGGRALVEVWVALAEIAP